MKVEFNNSVWFSGNQVEDDEIKKEMIVILQFLALYAQQGKSVRTLKEEAYNWLVALTYFDYGFGSSHMWITQEGQSDRMLAIHF